MKRLIPSLIFAIFALLPALPAREVPSSKLEIYKLWNRNVSSLVTEGDFETGLWKQLLDSLRADPPERVRSLKRQRIIAALIRLHNARTALLARMLVIEKQ